MKKVIIVSAFGRGVCLAHQLRQSGFEVSVWDVSALLPPLSLADREGPFGVFLPPHLSDLEKQHLCGDNSHPVRGGFSLLMDEGPLEFQGPLTGFFRKTRKDFELCYSVLQGLYSIGRMGGGGRGQVSRSKNAGASPFPSRSGYGGQVSRSKNGVASKLPPRSAGASPFPSRSGYGGKVSRSKAEVASPFPSRSELLEFSARWGGACGGGGVSSLRKGRDRGRGGRGSAVGGYAGLFSPFFCDYVLGERSQRYFEDVECVFGEMGVRWVDEFADSAGGVEGGGGLHFHKNRIHLKLCDREEEADFLVWTLSGPETKGYFPWGMSVLFPGWKEPVKIWRRFSLSFESGVFKDIIPSWLGIAPAGFGSGGGVAKSELSKAHSTFGSCMGGGVAHDEMFLYLVKNPAQAYADLWMLCPYADRFNEGVLGDLSKLALERLRELFPPGFSFEVFLPKAQVCHDYFVVYKNLVRDTYKDLPRGVFLLNPEVCGKMDPYSLSRLSALYFRHLRQ